MEDQEVEQEIVLRGFQQICDQLTKFRAGRKEHGDNLSELDCDKEMYDEDLDKKNYETIKVVQKREIKNKLKWYVDKLNPEFAKKVKKGK